MNWLHDPIVIGRLIILPLAVLCPMVVMLDTSILKRYPKNLWIRAISTIISVILCYGAIAGQILIFRLVTGMRQHVADDNGVFSILVFENLIALGLLFFRLRKSSSGSELTELGVVFDRSSRTQITRSTPVLS